jgi:hypothetical protein
MSVRSKLTWAWAWALGCAGVAAFAPVFAAAAEVASADANPYLIISDRNIFHLNPPPPPVAPEPPKPPDLPKVMLTGFIGKGNSIKVLLAIPPKEAKDPTTYLTLSPGEKGGQKGRNVELVKIYLDKEEVDIINSGTPQTLSVRSNSYAASSFPHSHQGGGPPAVLPGIPPGMPGMPPIHRPPNSYGPSATSSPSPAAATFGGGSSIIAGGGGGAFGSSASGAVVGGGAGFTPTANNVSSQITDGLSNPSPQNSHNYQTPLNNPPLPLEVQAAALLLQEAAGGPPAPPIMSIPRLQE